MSEILLKVSGLKVTYGGIRAVKGIDFEINRGEMVALIGANGAGKTTTLKAITGTLPGCQVEGEIHYCGRPIQGKATFNLVRRSIAAVPEGRGIFTRMTVMDNLLVGAHIRHDEEDIDDDIERWFETFPRLKERSGQLAGTLSGGEQQMLAIARALMTRPQLLLLDEPSMGLSPSMIETIFEVIRKVSAQGVTILLVEQNALIALETANRAYVMESGKIALSGNAGDVLHDPQVQVAYLDA
jgi:branched-chain amino acid transport system ATP-binding protein